MANKTRLILVSLFILALFVVIIPNSFAFTDSIDFSGFKENLADKWNMTEFASGIFLSVIFMSIFLFPTLLFSAKNGNGILPSTFVGIGTMSFCIAIEWLDKWFLLVIAFIIAILLADKIKNIVVGE